MGSELIPVKRWKARGMGRYLVVRADGDRMDIYRGAKTVEAARRYRREVPHWNARIYDQATDRFL